MAMFKEDRIATSLANQLHFDDITNFSWTSRTMRGAVFHRSPDQRKKRIDMYLPRAHAWVGLKRASVGPVPRSSVM